MERTDLSDPGSPVVGSRGAASGSREQASGASTRRSGSGAARAKSSSFAEISCSVDLDPAQRGVHMSRFPELFEQAIDELVIGEALLVEELAEHIARAIVGRQEALRAEVEVTARYPIQRETPVTRMRTQEMVSLIGIAAASAERHPPRRRRRGDRDQRLPMRAGARPRPCLRAAARSGLRRERGRADPRARPARDAQPARPWNAVRRHRRGR